MKNKKLFLKASHVIGLALIALVTGCGKNTAQNPNVGATWNGVQNGTYSGVNPVTGATIVNFSITNATVGPTYILGGSLPTSIMRYQGVKAGTVTMGGTLQQPIGGAGGALFLSKNPLGGVGVGVGANLASTISLSVMPGGVVSGSIQLSQAITASLLSASLNGANTAANTLCISSIGIDAIYTYGSVYPGYPNGGTVNQALLYLTMCAGQMIGPFLF